MILFFRPACASQRCWRNAWAIIVMSVPDGGIARSVVDGLKTFQIATDQTPPLPLTALRHAATARLAGNEPAGGSFGRRRCRFFGRVRTNSPAAKVRMPSTVMTPMAMLVRGHIRIRCCALWRRRPLVIRLGQRQILWRGNCRQCADNQGAAYKSDIHARLRVLPQIECRWR